MIVISNLLRIAILSVLAFIVVDLGCFHYQISHQFLGKRAQMVRVHDQQLAVSRALADAKDWRKTALYYQEQLGKASAINEQLTTDQSIARYELNTFLRVLQGVNPEAYDEVMDILKGVN